MADFETLAQFQVGTVESASISSRPDAIVPLLATAPGPSSLGETTDALLNRGWYARIGSDLRTVYLSRSLAEGSWAAEIELFTTAGDITHISLAFDPNARAIIAVEVAGETLLYEWTGASYENTETFASCTAPALVVRSPDVVATAEAMLFYERAGQVFFRTLFEDWATESAAAHTLSAGQRLWRMILGTEGRLHMILSTRNEEEGTYTLQRRTSPTWEPPVVGPPTEGLFGWWAADDLAETYADAETVATWPDLGPNGYDVTASGDPAFSAAGGPDGLPCVIYDGNDYHQRAATPRPGDGTSITMYAVYYWSGSGNTSVLSWRGSNASDRLETHSPYGGVLYFDHGSPTGGNGRINGAPPAGFAANWHIMEWHKPDSSGGTATISVDGTVVVSGAMTDALDTLSDVLRLMGGTAATTNGRLAEAIIYESARDAGVREDVMSYLADKYGIVLP